MKNKQPPFQITHAIIDLVSEIAELLGRLSFSGAPDAHPRLRRAGRIRSVHGSLAIEQNSLSLEQVTAILDGKRVLAPPRDIAEVKNAFEIYERLDELDPYSLDDLLAAHGVMTRGLLDESGVLRSRSVGVVDQSGRVLHFGTLPAHVPALLGELLTWTKSSTLHMLIRSCVFHYEFELIHPFADGNGRIGRLWHSLLLSRWNPIFAWLPIESLIHDHQDGYYAAFAAANSAAESTLFIEFMLALIKAALGEVLEAGDGVSDEMRDGLSDGGAGKAERRWRQIAAFLSAHEHIMNADVRTLCSVSAATANRILARLQAEGRLHRCRVGGHWAYRLPQRSSD